MEEHRDSGSQLTAEGQNNFKSNWHYVSLDDHEICKHKDFNISVVTIGMND